MRCLTRWRSWMSHRVGCVGESGEEPFEVLGELDVGLGVVQLGVERVQLGDSAQLGHPPAQLFERDELLLVGLDQSGAGRFHANSPSRLSRWCAAWRSDASCRGRRPSGHLCDQAMVAQLGRRRPVKRPGAVFAPADRARANQVAHRGGHGRAVRPDQVGQPLMRQRQSHCDALRSNTPPALSQVPEGQQEPIIDALVMGDRQRNRQRVRAPGGAAEELHAELRPRRHACHQTVVEHGQTRRLEHDPAHFGVDVGAVSVPTPGAHDIASTQQLDAPAPEYIDLPREQPVDDQEAAMMRVRLDRARSVPLARGETAYAGQRLAARALALRFVQQLGEFGVCINNADEVRYRAHVRSAAQENDHEDENHGYQAAPDSGQQPLQNSGLARSRE
jgi:hypothetical protein